MSPIDNVPPGGPFDQARPKRPATVLAGPYGHPFHPLLVTLPIGSWVAGLVFDIISKNSQSHQDAFARGAFVLVLIGIIGAVVAAIFGFMDFLTIPSRTPARSTALAHMALNTLVLVIMVVNAVVRKNQGLDSVSNTALALTIIALILLGASGSLGGKLSYTYGVRVADERTQSSGYQDRVAGRGAADDSEPAARGSHVVREPHD
jgi:uncharacterized membrane protein